MKVKSTQGYHWVLKILGLDGFLRRKGSLWKDGRQKPKLYVKER